MALMYLQKNPYQIYGGWAPAKIGAHPASPGRREPQITQISQIASSDPEDGPLPFSMDAGEARSPPAEAGGFIGEEDAIANHRRVNAAVSAGTRRLQAAEPPSVNTFQSFFSSFPSGTANSRSAKSA